MPNVGDIIRASDIAVPKGIVVPFYNVTLSGRYPIFWGDTEANTGWLVCDGGDDLHGGNVPDLRNRFIMGVVSVDEANKTGGSDTTSSTEHTHTGTISGVSVSATTITTSTMPSHGHTCDKGFGSPSDNSKYTTADSVPSRFITYINANATGGSQSHTHSLTGTITLASSGAHSHTLTPPYYSLIYLVKLP